MKKFTCALVALLAAVLFLPASTVAAASLPERASVRDAPNDVVGHTPGQASIDLLRVTGWRSGNFLYGRMLARNVLPGAHSTQQFVLWLRTRSGVLYVTTAKNGVLNEPPVRPGRDSLCGIEDVTLNWNVTANVVQFKMPMSCFKERPVAWQVGGISSFGTRAQSWDQTGSETLAKFSPFFASTP